MDSFNKFCSLIYSPFYSSSSTELIKTIRGCIAYENTRTGDNDENNNTIASSPLKTLSPPPQAVFSNGLDSFQLQKFIVQIKTLSDFAATEDIVFAIDLLKKYKNDLLLDKMDAIQFFKGETNLLCIYKNLNPFENKTRMVALVDVNRLRVRVDEKVKAQKLNTIILVLVLVCILIGIMMAFK